MNRNKDLLILYFLWKKQQTVKTEKRCWLRQQYQERQQKGEFEIHVKDLRTYLTMNCVLNTFA